MEIQGMICGPEGSIRPVRLAGFILSMVLAATAAAPMEARAQAGHARLGSPKTLSYLGQPLKVVIPIQMQPGSELSETRWAMGARPSQNGMPYLERGRLTVEQTAEGQALVIRSYTPVHEPAIGFVIQEFVGAGEVAREFAVLLDPPPFAPETLEATPAETGISGATSATPAGGLRTAPSVAVPNSAPLKSSASQVSTLPVAERRPSPRPAKKVEAPAAVTAGASSPGTLARQASPALRASPREAVSGPRLVLSLDSGLSPRKEASEEERAALRVRQMLLYLDDLTAAINERQNKIAQLEKELAGLNQLAALREELDSISLRVKNAELEARKADVSAVAGSRNLPDRPAAPASLAENGSSKAAMTAPANPPPSEPAAKPTGRAAPGTFKDASPSSLKTLWTTWWPALLLALGFASVILFAWLRRRQHQLSAPPPRDDEHFLWSAEAPGPDVEVPEEEGVRDAPDTGPVRRAGAGDSPSDTGKSPPATRDAVATQKDSAGVAAMATQRLAPPSTVAGLDRMSAERTWKLPRFELPSEVPARGESRGDEFPVEEGSGARRLRYLRIRYADISAMNPALDQPARLLHQAGQAYGEGAVEHAKRLLKFAAYSRPETEVFWLALLELLYRERWINEYSVTAHWFHKWCPGSIEWNEVLRLGYMLNPADSRFQLASLWSKVEPAAGLWLPVAAAATIALPHLDLQLVNE